MTTAYFDCFSGISGDMILGALVDLGVPLDWLKDRLRQLPLDSFDLSSATVMDNGLRAVRVHVDAPDGEHHRDFASIKSLIEGSPFSNYVKLKGLAAFERIADAEAHIHGCARHEVHFHEVGGLDAIIDILGACLGIEYLGITSIVSSALPLGGGFVQCRHGTLPVPAPATLAILKGVPVYAGTQKKELVTPTGAALITSLADSFAGLPPMTIERIGYGAGTHLLENQPNLLRVILGQADQASGLAAERLVLLETTIDDMNPEIFGHLMEKLFSDGALDVFWIPAFMKKNRPGTLVNVLCRPEQRQGLVHRILSETSTLGVRFHDVARSTLARRTVELDTPLGRLKAKQVEGPDGALRIIPEFEECRRIAEIHHLSLREVYEIVLCSAHDRHRKNAVADSE